MGKQGVKKRTEEDGSMDRISELPHPILHDILCYLPQKEAVQTCVLSKSWRHLGITRPKIEFHDTSMFLGSMRGKFMSVFEKTLQRYHDQNLSIQEFVLWFSPERNPQSVEIFESLTLMALQKGVKIFNFYIGYVSYPSLPSLIFQTQTLEQLYLHECRYLISIDKVLSKHLHTLSLDTVFIAEESLNKIFSSCPLLECVVLDRCKGLTAINVKELHNLTHFECHFISETGTGLETTTSIIEFNSQTLETIRIDYYPNWYQHHHNEYFPRLKTLYLCRVQLTTESFDIFSCNFPCLEELELVCDGFEQVRLSSPSIESLTIKVSGDSIKPFIIDAPNICYFEFLGDWPPTSFSITTTSKEQLESRIDLICLLDSDDDDDISRWFLLLNEMLKALTQFRISLNFLWFYYPKSPITFCDSYEPVQVENLIANGDLLSSDFRVSLNLLFRTCRPRYISGMYLYVDAKSEWKTEHNNQVDSLCNIFLEEISEETKSEFSYWIHDLEEVSMESFDENAQEWRLVQGTSWSECALSNNQSKRQICIRLKWRERKSSLLEIS